MLFVTNAIKKQIRKHKMGAIYSTQCMTHFGGQSEGTEPIKSPRGRWEDKNKYRTYRRDYGCEGEGGILMLRINTNAVTL
jgi:hypothetical protein